MSVAGSSVNERVKKTYDNRRKAKVCIDGGKKCGPLWKGGRCRPHHDKMLANRRRYRKESRERLAQQAAERRAANGRAT